jgi:mannose-6-phosphate isomerase-like protein (cupin superfamily)
VARAGDEIRNGRGDRLVFRRTAADTNGDVLEYDVFFRPGGLGAQEHVHPSQEERHEVVSGELGMVVGGRNRVLRAGDVEVVPPGTPHSLRRLNDDEIHMRVEIRPALRQEQFIETLFGLDRDGKTNEKGLPGLLQLAVIGTEFSEEGRGTRPPLAVQKVLLPPLAALGRLRGLRGTYPDYSRV